MMIANPQRRGEGEDGALVPAHWTLQREGALPLKESRRRRSAISVGPTLGWNTRSAPVRDAARPIRPAPSAMRTKGTCSAKG
jgi:hypothetical protein